MVNLARSMVRSAPIAAAFVICLWAGDADAWWWEPAPNISSVRVSHDQHNMRLNVRYNFNRGTKRNYEIRYRWAYRTAYRWAYRWSYRWEYRWQYYWSYEWQYRWVYVRYRTLNRGYRCYRYCYRRYTCWGGWWWRRCGWRTYCYTAATGITTGAGATGANSGVSTSRCSGGARCVLGWLTASATSRRTNRDISRPTDTTTRRVMVIPPQGSTFTVAGQLRAVTVTVARIGRPGRPPARASTRPLAV